MEKIDLSMLPTGALPSIVHCSQGDVNRKFQLALKDETGAAYTLDGTETLQITGFKPDGNFFIYDLPSQTGSVIEISTQEQMTARGGDVLCEVRIKKGQTNLGTCNFVLQVEVGPTESGTLSTSAIELVYSIIRRAEEAESTATGAAATATQAATNAINAASEASVYKADALAAKNAAVTAKDLAEQSYQSARTQATNANNAKLAAETAASNATGAKNLAVTARHEAEGFATSASTSASAAQTSATQAAASADAASASVDDAAEAAETAIAQVALATAQAEAAAQSASSALSSKNSASASASAANSASATAQTSATNAQASASAAHTSEDNAEVHSQNAETFATAAEEALEGLENMSVVATTLPTGADATVTKGTDAQGNVQLTFGLPRGEKGSGPGTEVIPNPEGEATEEMTKISIDGEIFSLAGGGSGVVQLTKSYFVDVVNGDDTATGDYQHPFKTVSKALSMPENLNITIINGSGETYSENLGYLYLDGKMIQLTRRYDSSPVSLNIEYLQQYNGSFMSSNIILGIGMLYIGSIFFTATSLDVWSSILAYNVLMDIENALSFGEWLWGTFRGGSLSANSITGRSSVNFTHGARIWPES